MAEQSLSACLAEIKMNPGKFYVYVLSRPCGSPFYVGCGKRYRISAHFKPAALSQRSRKASVVRKVLKSGGEVQCTIHSWHGTWADAASCEIALIAKLGRADQGRGPLANMTDGGEGAQKPSEASRRRAAERKRAQWLDPDYRAAMTAARRAMWQEPGRRDAASEAQRAAWAQPGSRDRRSKSMRKAWENPDYRERCIEASTAAVRTEEHRRSQGIRSAARMADPEARRRQSKALREHYSKPEAVEAHSARVKALWQREDYQKAVSDGLAKAADKLSAAGKKKWSDPEWAERTRAAIRASSHLMADAASRAWADPEHRAKVSASMKAAWARRKAAKAMQAPV